MTGPTLTLRDVADLAGVQRAVVSMWRRRPRVRGQLIPFPDPVPGGGPVERFRRDEVVAWLERTERGNNPEHRLDAQAWSVPAGASLEDLVRLLCLAAHADGDLADLTAAERESLAERADPGDDVLLSEVRHLAATNETLRFVDDLVEASYGLPEALARLEAGPANRALAHRDLTDEATELVAAVVAACTEYLDADRVPVAVTGCPTSLALAVASSARPLAVTDDGPEGRALRRRALLHDLDLVDKPDPPLAHLLSVVGLATDPALDRLDDLLVDLAPAHLAVVVGPASVLCERLRGEQERKRAQTLRVRRLVAALRLPRGLWRKAHRQALGLWVCAGDQSTDRPMVADLGAYPPAELSIDDVAADVSGALSSRDTRAFRYLRAADLPAILTGAPIVPPGVRAPRLRSPYGDHLDRVQAAALVTAEPQPPLDVLVAAAPGAVVLRQRSLGELREAGLIKVLRGSRIDPQHGTPDGSVPVLTGDPEADGVALDPLDAARLYPRARRTEPGDVVFAQGPPPRARVDERGGSLVASPARIIRLRPTAGAGPHTFAAIINYQSPTSEWPTWSVPLLDPAGAEALEAALVEAAAYGVALRQRQQARHDLITALIDGVAAGAVTVTLPGTIQERP
jgi:hypothetical protein